VSKISKKPTQSIPSTQSTQSTQSTPATTGGTIFIAPPPVIADFPAPPDGFTATGGAEYSGYLPKATQLAVLGGVIQELGRFTDYSAVLGRTAPPIASITQSFDAANQWSLMRVRTIAWEGYCLQQEGLAWIDVRKLMDQIQPLFEVAVSNDPSIGAAYPMMLKFFGAQRVIAAKGVATRKANLKAVAEGKAPTKGKVGKRRERAAQKAALLAAETAAPTAPAPVTPKPA